MGSWKGTWMYQINQMEDGRFEGCFGDEVDGDVLGPIEGEQKEEELRLEDGLMNKNSEW